MQLFTQNDPNLPTKPLLLIALITVPWVFFFGFDIRVLQSGDGIIPTGNEWILELYNTIFCASFPLAALFAWLAPTLLVHYRYLSAKKPSPYMPMILIHGLFQVSVFLSSFLGTAFLGSYLDLPIFFTFLSAVTASLLHIATPFVSAQLSLSPAMSSFWEARMK